VIDQPTAPPDSSRRTFCTHGCLSAAALALASLSAACGGGGNSSTSPGGSGGTGNPLATATASVDGRTVSVAVAGSPLAAVGGAALLRTSLGNYLVARTGQEAFSALTATCTHESNVITNFTGSEFACTFHGSLFTASGTVARGPATRPLTSYRTTFANNVVSFTV
jgi:cytochrome b6-f complex iron-sulfur subunit